MTFKCTACEGTHTTSSEMRECHTANNFLMKEAEFGRTVKKTVIVDLDKPVIVTCGYGKEAHKWETTKGEAIEHKACPEHR